MNSASKVAALTAVLLLLSLPLKLVWRDDVAKLQYDQLDQARSLRAWLDAEHTPVDHELKIKPGIWHGWQVRLPGCQVFVLPRPPFDDAELLHLVGGADLELRYIYEGQFYDSPPTVRTMFVRLRSMVAPFLARPSDKLMVVLAAPKGCRDYLSLDWVSLWKDQ